MDLARDQLPDQVLPSHWLRHGMSSTHKPALCPCCGGGCGVVSGLLLYRHVRVDGLQDYSFSRPLTAHIWHQRFMHRSWDFMEKLIRGDMVCGFPLTLKEVEAAKQVGICGPFAYVKRSLNLVP